MITCQNMVGLSGVLETLSEMFPQAPIYTAFAVKNSSAWHHFKHKTLIESSLAPFAQVAQAV